MDIQRGDQVYYRGEVWEVLNSWPDDPIGPMLEIVEVEDEGVISTLIVDARLVQRVEQVR